MKLIFHNWHFYQLTLVLDRNMDSCWHANYFRCTSIPFLAGIQTKVLNYNLFIMLLPRISKCAAVFVKAKIYVRLYTKLDWFQMILISIPKFVCVTDQWRNRAESSYVITWTNVDLSSKAFSRIHLRTISQWVFICLDRNLLNRSKCVNILPHFPRGQWVSGK